MSAPWVRGLWSRNLFFTGKGGVGKTSLACATALAFAEQNEKTLIVSTDPASNLDEVLGATLGPEPTPIPGIAGLFGMNIDPEEAARRYRERAVEPFRGLLPEATIRSMEEGLSGACTNEIAAFDEFTALLGRADHGFDRIVFDTAPTGHTLRLLSLPRAWTGFIDTNTSGITCLGPLSGLAKQAEAYRASLDTLCDADATTILLVSRPDEASLKEAARASSELYVLGVENQRLVVNGLFKASSADDPLALALERRGIEAMRRMPARLKSLETFEVPLLATNVVGLVAVRLLLGQRVAEEAPADLPEIAGMPFGRLVDSIAEAGSGVVMTMGKGGVGKTTIAALIAIELASRGHRVLLSTTDPAAHLLDAVATRPASLEIGRIDPETEVERYRAEVIAAAGDGIDDEGLELLKEDLRSPCTEEIAVFRAFAEAVSRGTGQFVVLDTAPTGHTILLLDAAEAYHREVLRTASELPDSVRELLPRLRDPEFTKVLIVTVPEPTPVHEAHRLQDDLVRAGIRPYAWIVNQSLASPRPSDPVLRSKAAQERTPLAEVGLLAARMVVLPWTPNPESLMRTTTEVSR